VFRKILMRALVAPVIGAVVVAGGIAYAEVGDEVTDEPPLEEEVVEDPAPEEEVVEDEVIEDEVVEDEVVEDEVVEDEVVEDEVVEDEVVEDEVVEEHPDNHGKLVSETARNTPPGPGHGAAVSAVARSKSHPGSEDS
jgi:hypothetical protein